ncbi:hypothetical protein IP87_17515 [beta proteobacterium AAP121]|nr:hypothetical protein IP80_15640 [beta proteobacterium AAP65]KPF95106.1 hypothetical protein IP87_17515 [beta proteobacterium AAP121]
MQAHEAGRLDEARRAYQALLTHAPEHPDALHLLGLLEAQNGQLQAGLALLRRAVAVAPNAALFHNNLGNALVLAEEREEAERSYRRALALEPQRPDVLNNLALVLGHRNELAEAEALLLQARALAPGFTPAAQNLASLCLRQDRIAEALQHCTEALVVAPRQRALRNLLARAYLQLGQVVQAREVYQRWAEEEPEDPVPRHHLAALDGQALERADDRYVKVTFDRFADSFDQTLDRLGYRAPALVGRAVAERLPGPPGRWRVLDAGCGTGLCGPVLRPHARELVGVDLSPRMLARAQQRSDYDGLHEGELVAFLQAWPAHFDLIASADTLCYFGSLQAFAQAAHASLAGRGWVVFTAEGHEDTEGAPEYRLHPHGRYSHRRSYLEQVLLSAGFDAVDTEAVVLRHELQLPVQGWLVCARLGTLA